MKMDAVLVLIVLASILLFELWSAARTFSFSLKIHEGKAVSEGREGFAELTIVNEREQAECRVELVLNGRGISRQNVTAPAGVSAFNFSLVLPDGKNEVAAIVDC